MYAGIGQTPGQCPLPGQMCFRDANTRDSARTMCQFGTAMTPLPGPCPSGNVISSDNLDKFRPCEIAHFELCSAQQDPGGQVAQMQQQQSAFGPAFEDDEFADEPDYTMWYVGGAIAVVVVGAGAYFFMKKR